jgi:alanine-synthesizing transaminase
MSSSPVTALASVESSELLEARYLDPHQALLHDELDGLRRIQRERATSGLSIYDLSMVNPDMVPPRALLDRLLESVTKTANHRYAVSRGVRRLREGFSAKYRARFGHALDPESDICVCLGSKDATFHALRVLIEAGDGVIVPVPAYPAHPSAVALTGGRCTPWNASREPLEAARELEILIAESRARVLLVNFPSNPMGITVTRQWWLEIGKVCAAANVTILNDFVYGEMCFSGEPAHSALCVTEVGATAVEVYSLSKAYNVPGWRVGALVGDTDIVSTVSRLKSQADYGLFLPLQYAAAQALISGDDLVSATVQTYHRRLKVLGAGLAELGWGVTVPEAGASVWAKYPEKLAEGESGSRFNSVNVARHLLDLSGVVVTPGILFGSQFDGYVRLAAVTNEERLRDAVGALRKVA